MRSRREPQLTPEPVFEVQGLNNNPSWMPAQPGIDGQDVANPSHAASGLRRALMPLALLPPTTLSSPSSLTQGVALSVADVEQPLLLSLHQDEVHHGREVVHGHLVEAAQQRESLEEIPTSQPPTDARGSALTAQRPSPILGGPRPEIPELLGGDGQVEVAAGPAVAPVVPDPDVVSRVRQDEGQAAVGEVVHPVTTIQTKPMHYQHRQPGSWKRRYQVADRRRHLSHTEIKLPCAS